MLVELYILIYVTSHQNFLIELISLTFKYHMSKYIMAHLLDMKIE